MAERGDDERRDENQEAAAALAGALLGTVAGPHGALAGAWLGAKLKRWVIGVWAELSESARERQTDVLFWAIHEGVPVDEMEARIKASKQTELLTGLALDAAWQTTMEGKLRTLGSGLASGLLAEDTVTIDTEQMIMAAVADIEGPQLAMLELMVAWRPGRNTAEPLISGPLNLPEDSHWRPYDDPWDIAWREWSRGQIAHARPNLAPIAPSLLGTLQRHGLVVQNQNTDETIERLQTKLESAFMELYAHSRDGGGYRPAGAPRLGAAGDVTQEPTWSPTELGETVFLRFLKAGANVPDGWAEGPADQQEQP
jgi:hypothetical protein